MRTLGYALALGGGLLLSAGGCDCGRITSVEGVEPNPVSATATVPGGVKARSPNYQLTTTTTSTAGDPQSLSFSVRTGVVGATQSTTSEVNP